MVLCLVISRSSIVSPLSDLPINQTSAPAQCQQSNNPIGYHPPSPAPYYPLDQSQCPVSLTGISPHHPPPHALIFLGTSPKAGEGGGVRLAGTVLNAEIPHRIERGGRRGKETLDRDIKISGGTLCVLVFSEREPPTQSIYCFVTTSLPPS